MYVHGWVHVCACMCMHVCETPRLQALSPQNLGAIMGVAGSPLCPVPCRCWGWCQGPRGRGQQGRPPSQPQPRRPPRPGCAHLHSLALTQVIQGLVIGRLSSHFSEGALLRASVLVFSVVGLAMVRDPPLHPTIPEKSRVPGPLHWSALEPRGSLAPNSHPGPPQRDLRGGRPLQSPQLPPASRQALMANVFHFCLLMPGLVFSMCALNVVTDSMLTKAVSTSDTGE